MCFILLGCLFNMTMVTSMLYMTFQHVGTNSYIIENGVRMGPDARQGHKQYLSAMIRIGRMPS